MPDVEDLPNWSSSSDSLPPLGDSPAMAAARRYSRATGGRVDGGFDEVDGVDGLADRVLTERRRPRVPALLAPLLVLAAGFVAGIFIASEVLNIGSSEVSADAASETVDPPASAGLNQPTGGLEMVPDDLAVVGADDQASGAAIDQGAEEMQLAPLLIPDGERNFVTEDRYEVRYGGGKLYLTGVLPNQEVADVIVERAGAIVGVDNLIVSHTFDPTVVIEPDIEVPIIVEDVVYFEVGSATIAPEFYPLIDLGSLLLRLNPQASITVLTYTDASGSAESNLELSRQRGQAVMDYHVFMGGNPDQLILDARGEEGAIEGADAQLAAEQRRAEFILNGFLNGLFD